MLAKFTWSHFLGTLGVVAGIIAGTTGLVSPPVAGVLAVVSYVVKALFAENSPPLVVTPPTGSDTTSGHT